VFVLDLSGSMNGDRLTQLKTAMLALTGTDQSLTGQFARFRAHEQVTIVTFASQVDDTREFTIDDTNPDGPDMTAIRTYIDGLSASGGTAIYDGLEQAYQVVANSQAKDPNRLFSIVLMTDGENNAGVDPKGFASDFAALPPAVQAVHTYPVLFGEANKDAMTSIATMTGGALFDATTTSLQTIFKQIRGYQ
jgi:Ca-activated chloride channel family protein